MITNRLTGPRGLWEDNEFYGFYVRLRGEERELLQLCHAKATREREMQVGNDVLLKDLMLKYLEKPKAYIR